MPGGCDVETTEVSVTFRRSHNSIAGRGKRIGSAYYNSGHVQLGRETVGVHLSYLYNKRIEYKLNGITAGISYNPSFHPQLRLIAEYDSKDFALGATYLLFNHLHAQVELQRMKYFTGGLTFQFRLSGKDGMKKQKRNKELKQKMK